MAPGHVTCSIYILVWIVTMAFARSRLIEVTVGVFVETSDFQRLQYLNNSLVHESLGNTEVNVSFKLSPEVSTHKYDTFSLARTLCRHDASVVVSFLPCPTNKPLTHVTKHVTVPMVSWSPCTISEQTDWAFAMTSIGLHYRTMISAIVKKERWQRLVLFYDEYADVSVVEGVIEDLGEEQVTLVQLNHQRAFGEHRRAFFIQQENYVMYCNRNNIYEVLQKARLSRLDILGPRYKWLLLDEGDLDFRNVTSLLQEGDNLAIIRPHAISSQETISTGAAAIMDVVASLVKDGYDVSQSWNCTNTLTANFSEEFQHRIKVRFGLYNRSGATFSVWTFTHQASGDMGLSQVGNWSASHQLDMWSSLYPQLVQGFNNRTFVITAFQYEPFIMLRNNSWQGLLLDFMDELSFALNFSFIIRESEEAIFGRQMANGSFNGLIGKIQRKEADFALGPISIVHDRAQVVDFTTPYWGDPYIILLRKPDPGESMIFICLGPFSVVVWVVIILSVIVVSVVLWTSLQYYPGPEIQPALPGVELLKLTTWQTFGALMQQGMVQQPVVTSGRVIVAMWWFYVIVIAGVYNGNLIAFLTAPKAPLPIKSLGDLAKSDMTFGTLKDAAFHGTLVSASGGVYKQLWDKVKDNVDDLFYADSNQGLKRALADKNYAYIIEESFYTMLHVKNTSLKEKQCLFVRPKADFLPNMYGLVFQKDSPYTKMFSMQILRILESGLLERIKHKWLSNGNRCTGLERVSKQTNIGLLEAQGAFYILAIGMVAASLVLVIECSTVSSCSKRGLFDDGACSPCFSSGRSSGREYQPKPASDRVCNISRSDLDVAISNGAVCSDGDSRQQSDTSTSNVYDMDAMETLAYVDIITGAVTQSNTVYNTHSNHQPKGRTAANGVMKKSVKHNGTYASASKQSIHRRAGHKVEIVRLSITGNDGQTETKTETSTTL